jgi:hypothetical protein
MGSGRPTLVLKAHALINQSLTGVNVKQINIAPTASVFGPDVLAQFRFFQQYRITRVSVRFINMDPVNYQTATTPLELPLVYEVPMINNQVPAPAESAYLAYKNVKYFSYRKDFSRTFTPYVNSSELDDRIFVKSPRLPTNSTNDVHYGMSFLFIKPSATALAYTLRAVITADIELYSYDGNQGVALLYEPDPDLYVS